ncbi:unnamed protein product [Musa acuminata subsp. malaccensis]|uniref:(wild Malaysian banana) hypothetical protein n=1 Tax=Musa acuminata subsp. malaccensis TaxID=214687 RepID=A0A804I977_MUSAM|nr:unnamed protein product [Musa acuminata subsp. malaccensis]
MSAADSSSGDARGVGTSSRLSLSQFNFLVLYCGVSCFLFLSFSSHSVCFFWIFFFFFSSCKLI